MSDKRKKRRPDTPKRPDDTRTDLNAFDGPEIEDDEESTKTEGFGIEIPEERRGPTPKGQDGDAPARSPDEPDGFEEEDHPSTTSQEITPVEADITATDCGIRLDDGEE